MTLLVERRRPAFTPDLLLRVALAWAMICGLLLVTNLTAILAFQFPDPDDTLRLMWDPLESTCRHASLSIL